MKKIKKLQDEYRFPGFYPRAVIKGKFGDHTAKVIQLIRRQKKLFVDVVEQGVKASMIVKSKLSGICHAVMPGFIYQWKYGESIV
ncbi:MAG: hypothetical protein COX30_00865 [Candidatus Moranbacteria bacterium CG23_combo_of_CG06-09_8_20_14_all_39_10]|nr:MAG: hypothetical protein COX30_00865 [Candidatus Moranbacteria bacterium CG23_combo_of_CG06-09_8_20_14_all_39_10]